MHRQLTNTSRTAFWAGKERFYLRGIDYQPGGSSANIDPLADTSICKRDIAKFKDLGVNVIRVYTVDNSADHDDCMSALADAEIYLVLDVNNNKYSINRADPGTSYNTAYLQSVFATVEMFAKYTNTLAFFSGNEVINDEADTDKSAPYVKAVTRDMKNYMNARDLRAVPVGYSAADVSSNRMQTAQYMNCGSSDMRSDFFAFNDYSWCNSDFETSGWDVKVKNFTDYGLPILYVSEPLRNLYVCSLLTINSLSEYGCTKNRPRKFDELTALMSSKMDSVYSGGLMYEYSQEDNKYGIVTIGSDDKVTTLSEYANFKTALAENAAPTGDGGADSTTHSQTCPTSASNWQVNPSLVPEMPEQASKYFTKGAGDGPGLKGDGSQDQADSGTATASVTGGTAVATGSSSTDDSAAGAVAPLELAPLAVTCAAIFFTMMGAFAL